MSWLTSIFSKDPVKEFEKLKSEQLRRKYRQIGYEMDSVLAEARRKEEEIAKKVESGAEASETEMDELAADCAMLREEVRAIRVQLSGLRNLKYVAHTMWLLKKYNKEIIKGIRVDLEKMIHAKSLDELSVIVGRIQRDSRLEIEETRGPMEEISSQTVASEIPLSSQAQAFKKEMLALRSLEGETARGSAAKEKARELINE